MFMGRLDGPGLSYRKNKSLACILYFDTKHTPDSIWYKSLQTSHTDIDAFFCEVVHVFWVNAYFLL